MLKKIDVTVKALPCNGSELKLINTHEENLYFLKNMQEQKYTLDLFYILKKKRLNVKQKKTTFTYLKKSPTESPFNAAHCVHPNNCN